MVSISEYHALDAIHKGWHPFRIVHKPCALIDPLESMGLEIGLVYDIKAKIIAQLEKIGMIGIVRSTDSVDIMLLHQKNILKHRPPGDISSGIRMKIMTIYTL